MDTHPGVYCLRTNELSWDGEQLCRTYIMCTDLEEQYCIYRALGVDHCAGGVSKMLV